MSRTERMDKTAFLKALEGRGPEELRTLLWTAYWRGGAPARERIEEQLFPAEAAVKRETAAFVDAGACLEEVRTFCSRARAGDYMRGARDLGRKEVSGWRLTFRRLFEDATRALRQPGRDGDPAPLVHLLDFTFDLRNWEYFRSQDPVEAAKIVFSDRVAVLWRARIDEGGFGAFLQEAPAQFVRWESRFGWTRYDGKATGQQRTLTEVLQGLLPGPDALLAFVRGYLAVLERLQARNATAQEARTRSSEPSRDWRRDCEHRADQLEAWNALLLERLGATEDASLLERILTLPALDGPETWHLLARLRARQGRRPEAQSLVRKALDRYPGAMSIRATATELGL
jgi:hypothetical protein